MKTLHTFLCLLLMMVSNIAFSGVNLKNGNFYISYMDMKLNSDAPINEITRTYNSKSSEKGIFGFGWGVLFETRLFVYPDASLVVKEHGAGGKTYFISVLSNQESIDLMVDQLIDAAVANGNLKNTPNEIMNRRQLYFNNQPKRLNDWDKYVEKGLLQFETNFEVGTQWKANQRGNQTITLTSQGFERTTGNKLEVFNNIGQLIKIDKGYGKWSKIFYEKGKLSKIENYDGTFIEFSLSEEGFVTELKSKEQLATFKYKENDLFYSQDVERNAYSFHYDANHNLTKIVYNPNRPKGTEEDAMHMEYEPKTGYVSKVTDRNGEYTSYSYNVFYKPDGTIDEDHYSTDVTKLGFDGVEYTNTYEYVIGVKNNGERFTQKIITIIRGIKTETTYDGLCDLPIEIARGSRKTTMKYNNKCLMTEKITDSEEIYISYHPTLDKITKVSNNDGVTEFEYDAKGELIYAKKGDNWVKLHYDNKGKITMMEQDTNSLVFTYNDKGKPVKIEMENEGAINISYDDYGEIKKVESEDGYQMSLKVTQAFQNLLTLIKPAGVNLGM